MDYEHHYHIGAKWDELRKGTLHSDELSQKIEVATPPPFPGGMEHIWSPEHFFVAAVNSCLMTTFLAIAEHSKLEFKSFHCNARGKLERVDGKYMMSTIELHPVVEIMHEGDREKAMRILEKSEAACLISNSIKSSVHMHPVIAIASESK